MSTTWTQTTLDVIRGALQLCQAVGVGENVSSEDADLCMTALDGVIKELPSHGFAWPQLTSAPVAVTWSGGTPSVVTPPTDYFGNPTLKYRDASTQMVEIVRVPKAYWETLDTTKTATYPQFYYVAPDLSFNLWPTPTQNPNLTLSYQKIIPDLVLTAAPSIQQQYLNTLQYLVADEVSLKFGVPQDVRAEIAARAGVKKNMMIQWATDLGPISFMVIDGSPNYPRSPLEW